MAGGFGHDSDLFGKADTYLKLVSSTKTPRAGSVAEARDSIGNITAEQVYGKDSIYEAECIYVLKGGTKTLSAYALGGTNVDTVTGPTTVVSGIDITTDQGDWPGFTFKGVIGAVGMAADTPTFTLPATVVTGKKIAQGLGFTLAAGAALNSSAISYSGDISEALDSTGSVTAQALTGAAVEASGDAVEVTGVITVTWDTDFTEVQPPGATKGNTAFGTGSFSARKFLAAS